jgi:hypothetical protein
VKSVIAVRIAGAAIFGAAIVGAGIQTSVGTGAQVI